MHTEQLSDTAVFDQQRWISLIQHIRHPLHLVSDPQTGRVGLVSAAESCPYPVLSVLPPMYPEWLGDQAFLQTHGVRFPYIVGKMANGIATADMVIAAAQAGMMGFFGAAGLMPEVVEENILKIQAALGPDVTCWGSNLIHAPNETNLEEKIVDLYLRLGVRRVSASAYMTLNPFIVYYACKGLWRDETGCIHRQNYVLAKISRPEVAAHFIAPPPKEMLASLVEKGKLTPEEAELGAQISVAEDITVEGDSGGHTDNRPLVAMLPVIQLLSQQLQAKYGFPVPTRVGAAGGLGTPASVAGAFSLGAAYVLTGSVNQSAVESGQSQLGKEMLAQAGIADVIMAPAADMFELGVKLQILKRGSLFAGRATKLYEIYNAYSSLEEIPTEEKQKLEKQIFQTSIEEIWTGTRLFFSERDPEQVERAERDPKHKMALVFRWYLGLSSRWAMKGEPSRKLDYQIWCGPAMGAFNDWVKGSFLEELSARTVEQIGRNLMEGAVVVTRAHHLRTCGLPLPNHAFAFQPRPLS